MAFSLVTPKVSALLLLSPETLATMKSLALETAVGVNHERHETHEK